MREFIEPDTMDETQHREDLIRMQEGMKHVISTVDEIKRTMATQKDLELLATKAEVSALAARLDGHERDTHRELEAIRQDVVSKSPGALWRTVTGWASGLVVVIAAVALLIKWAKGLP
jgi:hypothetical protein